MSISELGQAARVLAGEGLVTAFGHISKRVSKSAFVITPPRPLGTVTLDEPGVAVSLETATPPPGSPGELWMHWAIYRARPELQAICRAQPEMATAMAGAGITIRARHGQGAFLGREVPVYDDARLIRSQAFGEALATRLGQDLAMVLRGNGAITAGESLGEAVARMWVLEVSARMNHVASAPGAQPRLLTEEEFASWQGVSKEILTRIWLHLAAKVSQ